MTANSGKIGRQHEQCSGSALTAVIDSPTPSYTHMHTRQRFPWSSLCRPFVRLGQVLWWLAAAALLSRMRAKAQQLGLHNSHGSLQQYASFLMSNVPGLSDSAPSGDATVGSATADAVTLDGGVIPFVLARVAAVASRAVSAASTFIAEVPV